MCYDVSSGLRALIKYAKHRHDDPDKIKDLEKQLEVWRIEEHRHFHMSGFQHQPLMVFTNEAPDKVDFFKWGLIPSWNKDEITAKTMSNMGLNARVETIFEKPMFKNGIRNKRCLVYIDGFFEYHHYNKYAYPFYISMKEDIPMVLAGIWESWTNRITGEVINTVGIITTKANKLMSKIHNNPKLTEARMPAILSKSQQNLWLKSMDEDLLKSKVSQLLLPFPDDLLEAYTVGKLKGKFASADTEDAIKKVVYEELVGFENE